MCDCKTTRCRVPLGAFRGCLVRGLLVARVGKWSRAVRLFSSGLVLALFFSLMQAAFPFSARAGTVSVSLETLLHADKYMLPNQRGELRIPFYLPERALIGPATLTLSYTRSETLRAMPIIISLLLDDTPIEASALRNSGGTAAISFDLPSEKLVPGTRTAMVVIRQPFASTDKPTPETHWTLFDLRQSYLAASYEAKPLGDNKRNLDFLFDGKIAAPKEVTLVLEKFDVEHIKRAIIVAQKLAIRLVERPLHVFVAATPAPDQDSVLIGDSFLRTPPVVSDKASYAQLTEDDLRDEAPFRRNMLVMGASLSFKDLGLDTLTFQEYTAAHHARFIIPSLTRLSSDRKLTLSLDLAYSAGLPPGAKLEVMVNGAPLAWVGLNNPQGETRLSYRVDVPTSLLAKGVNQLSLHPAFARPSTDEPLGDQKVLEVFNTSFLALPYAEAVVQSPNLASIFTDGYPFVGENRVYLKNTSPEGIAALINIGALIAQKRGTVGQDVRLYLTDWEPGGTNSDIFFVDPALPEGDFSLKTQDVPGVAGKITFSIIGKTEKDLLAGVLSLWEPTVQSQVRGDYFAIDLASRRVFPGQDAAASGSGEEPFGMAVYTEAYPMLSRLVGVLLIVLFCGFIWKLVVGRIVDE